MWSVCGSYGLPPYGCDFLQFGFWSHHSGPYDINRLFVSMIAPDYVFATPIRFTGASDFFGAPMTPPHVIAGGPRSFFISFVDGDPILDQPDDAAPPFELILEAPFGAAPSNPYVEPPAFDVTAWGPTGNVVFSTTPEPTTLLLVASGLAALVARRARRQGRRVA